MLLDLYMWAWAHLAEIGIFCTGLCIGGIVGAIHGHKEAIKKARKAHRIGMRSALKDQYRRDHAWHEVG